MNQSPRPRLICDECGSPFFAGSSAMTNLCPECAHHLYEMPPCDHVFERGHCIRCGWTGRRSSFVRRLLSPIRKSTP